MAFQIIGNNWNGEIDRVRMTTESFHDYDQTWYPNTILVAMRNGLTLFKDDMAK